MTTYRRGTRTTRRYAKVLQPGTQVLVVETFAACAQCNAPDHVHGHMVRSIHPAYRKTGALLARVVQVTPVHVREKGSRRTSRVYRVRTSEGLVEMYPPAKIHALVRFDTR